MTISTNAVKLLLLIASLFGVEISEDLAVNTISAIVLLITVAKMVIDQVRRPNTRMFLFKE